MTATTGRRTYAPEFKEAAVARVRLAEESVAEIAAHLDVATSTLRTWTRNAPEPAPHVVVGEPVPTPSPPALVTPPTKLRALFWALGWRLPTEYGEWTRSKIESPQYRRALLIRLWTYGAIGFLTRIVASELVLFRPKYTAEFVIVPLALLVAFSASYLVPSRAARIRHMALVAQGLEPGTGASRLAKTSNTTKLVLPVAIVVLAFVTAMSAAQTSHSTVCPPGATGSVANPFAGPLDEALVAPTGFVQRPETGTGQGELSVADITASTKHPSDAAKVLRCNGFSSGYGRMWAASSGTPRGIYTKVYEFVSDTGAHNYARLDTLGTLKMPGISRAVVPDLFDATLLPSSVPDSAHFNYATIIGSTGHYVYVVREFTSGAVPLAEIEAVAKQQADALRSQ